MIRFCPSVELREHTAVGGSAAAYGWPLPNRSLTAFARTARAGRDHGVDAGHPAGRWPADSDSGALAGRAALIYGTEDLRMSDRKDGHATLSVDRAHGKAGEVAVPGDEIAAGAGDGSRLVASQADREQVLDALKAAFVQGRLAKDEFDLRVGKVLATYAELDALTADIPAALTAAQPPESARESHNKRLVQRGTAAGAGASVVLVGALVLAANGSPVLGLVIGGVVGAFMTVLLAGLLTLLSWVLEKGSRRRPSQALPPGASGRTSQRLASVDPAGSPSEISPVPPHTAEATRSGLSRPPVSRLRPPRRWRIAYAQARPRSQAR